jgi:hypothetical protein
MAAIGVTLARGLGAAEREENFDRDPGWVSHNSRSASPPPQEVRQEFGYSPSRHAGGDEPGELGGFINPAAEAAYYAKSIPTATLSERLTASGKLSCMGRHFHVLVGFFNSDTLNEWRTPNTIALRLYGRGDVFYAYVEYATSRWRAGGDSPGGFATVADPETGKPQLRGFASRGEVHTWSLTYDPSGNGGSGSITATIDDETAVCHLDPGHKQDTATFNRFGLVNVIKHYDTGGELWLDDMVVNGQTEDFARDPQWDARGNRRTYMTNSVRPRFDFGWTATNFAGGRSEGELGGLVFRGDNRYPQRLAYYADRLEPLALARPLLASGKLSLLRGVSDSTSLVGFFHSDDSIAVSDTPSSGFPMNFLGMAIEGPSRDGFFFYPSYRLAGGAEGYARGPELPHILPDGLPHNWRLQYEPEVGGDGGRILVTFDGQKVELEMPDLLRHPGVRFDRFGVVTTWIDGNGQDVYLDDLTYTFRQD